MRLCSPSSPAHGSRPPTHRSVARPSPPRTSAAHLSSCAALRWQSLSHANLAKPSQNTTISEVDARAVEKQEQLLQTEPQEICGAIFGDPRGVLVKGAVVRLKTQDAFSGEYGDIEKYDDVQRKWLVRLHRREVAIAPMSFSYVELHFAYRVMLGDPSEAVTRTRQKHATGDAVFVEALTQLHDDNPDALPDVVFGENVTGLEDSKDGVWDNFLKGMSSLGYEPHYARISTKHVGLPQKRLRLVHAMVRRG